MKSPYDLAEAKERIRIADLWRLLSLPGQPGKSCHSPFREDHNPSFSIFDCGQRWKDFATGETGDAVDFLARARNLNNRDACREFLRLAGVTPPAKWKPESPFDWQRCIATFTGADAERLTAWRGIPVEFFNWLHAQGQLGIYDGKAAFAVRDQAGAVVSCHFTTGKGKWSYQPRGRGTHAMIFGEVAKAGFVLAFESQWDAFAVMERIGWHNSNGVPDTAVFITRGAGNAKLIRGQVSVDAVVYAFPQNDAPGRRWLAELATFAGGKVLNVATPQPHKDANLWMQAGASKVDVEAALAAAHPIAAECAGIDAAGGGDSFEKITAEVRGAMLKILLSDAALGSKRVEVSNVAVSALCRVGRFYFHAERKDFDSAMFFDGFRKRLLRIRADAFGAWLSDWVRINRADHFFKYVSAAVETAAVAGEQTTGILPESFWAARPGAIFLSNGDGSAVQITPSGVRLVDNGAEGVLFAAGKTLQPWKLTEPRDVFETCAIFRDAHCIAGHAPDLLRLWLFSLPTNPRCKPPLCLAGEVGSGKTRSAKAFAELYGVPFVAAKVEESEESNFWPACDQGGIFTLDNADSKCRWLADALASAATDGCSQRRRLYTNSEVVSLRARAWLCVTSANPTFASDSGLADRLILVRMSRRAGQETSDSALTDEILANRDASLSHVAFTLQKALADTAPTPPGLNARHPDFAAFAVRIGRALGREAEAVAALQVAESDKASFCLENDPIASALLAFLRDAGQFSGTAAELVPHLVEVDKDLEGRLSNKRLGKRIAMLWPHLETVLQVAKRQENHQKVAIFTLKARQEPESAGCAGFETVFSQKSPYAPARGEFCQNSKTKPANPAEPVDVEVL